MADATIDAERTSNFRDWTRGRTVHTIGTNYGSDDLPFQNWRKFKEAFAPELINQAAEETSATLRRPVSSILDPFGGSGTTALAAQFLNIRPTTIEVNPFLADLIEAKVTLYDLPEAAAAFGRIVETVHDHGEALRWWENAPETFVEPGKSGRFLFSLEVAERLGSYLRAINMLADSCLRRLFKVLLGGIVIQVSNVIVSGKGRRYRNKPNPKCASDVDNLFKERVLTALYDLRKFERRPCRNYKLLRGDARKLIAECDTVDLAVFSPPYPNSFDYTDVYNVELWVLGYLESSEGNRRLREATLRSHVQIKRDMSSSREMGDLLVKTVSMLDEKRAELWNRSLPEMVVGYVDDMCTVMAGVRDRLASRGRVYMVVGDSRYAGVDVPVAKILAEAAPHLGYSVVDSFPFRSMRASPQQGGRAELPETLLVFQV